MTNTRHKVLLDTASADTGEWIQTSIRSETDQGSVIQFDIVSGDTVVLEGITKPFKGVVKDFTTLDADDITQITSKTADGFYLLEGNWTYIRAVKTGTTGNAKVQGKF